MSTASYRSLRGLALALCFVVVLAPVVRAEAMTPAAGAIRASVIATTGMSVDAITVRVVNLATAEQAAVATTDAAGNVTLPELPEGTYHVSAIAPEGFVASAAPLVELTSGVAADVAITLSPLQEGENEEEDETGGAGLGTTAILLLALFGAGALTALIIGINNNGSDDVVTQ